MLLVPINDYGHMILKGYTVTPELLTAFKRHCGPGDCTELAAMINKKRRPMTVISRMQEIANHEDPIMTWQKIPRGSFDSLMCIVGKFEYYVDESGPHCTYKEYNIIDREVWVQGRVPDQEEWLRMCGVEDLLIDRKGRWEGKAAHFSRYSLVPDQEAWIQMIKRNLLYPRKSMHNEWVYKISEGADIDELRPFLAAKACGSDPAPGLEIPLDRHISGPQMPPVLALPNRERDISRSLSPSSDLSPRSNHFNDGRSSRRLHPPRSRSPSLKMRSGHFDENQREGHSHPRNRSHGKYRSPSPEEHPLEVPPRSHELHGPPAQRSSRRRHPPRSRSPSPEEHPRSRHHGKNPKKPSSKNGKKKSKLYIWRKHGEIHAFRRKAGY